MILLPLYLFGAAQECDSYRWLPLFQKFVEGRDIAFFHQFRMEDGNKVFKQKVRMDRSQLVVWSLLHVAVDDHLAAEYGRTGFGVLGQGLHVQIVFLDRGEGLVCSLFLADEHSDELYPLSLSQRNKFLVSKMRIPLFCNNYSGERSWGDNCLVAIILRKQDGQHFPRNDYGTPQCTTWCW